MSGGSVILAVLVLSGFFLSTGLIGARRRQWSATFRRKQPASDPSATQGGTFANRFHFLNAHIVRQGEAEVDRPVSPALASRPLLPWLGGPVVLWSVVSGPILPILSHAA
jgi:hypothetical protein